MGMGMELGDYDGSHGDMESTSEKNPVRHICANRINGRNL